MGPIWAAYRELVSGRVESVGGNVHGRSIRENVKVGPGQGAHQVIVLVVEEI